MTLDDWWVEIERYTRAGDKTGLLVCADGVEECGEPDLAATLRWAVRVGSVPGPPIGGGSWIEWFRTPPPNPVREMWHHSCEGAWTGLTESRLRGLEFYQ